MREPKDITINNKTLEQILTEHKHWINEDCDGWETMCAVLRYADLCDANLYGADLYGADLRGADLRGADLRCADLRCADLRCADLRYADLRYADLRCADLRDADLYGAKGKLIEYRRGKVLTEDIIGYKKCRHDVIVTLLIPRGAIVFSINGDECRTNRAKVIGIDGANRAYSEFNGMSYYVGDEFTIYDFNCVYNDSWGAGIHFFMSKEEAENYYD